jgi:hypothetical protein
MYSTLRTGSTAFAKTSLAMSPRRHKADRALAALSEEEFRRNERRVIIQETHWLFGESFANELLHGDALRSSRMFHLLLAAEGPAGGATIRTETRQFLAKAGIMFYICSPSP